MEIINPIIPGMAPDPSIVRVNDTYYIATSTFHWQPGIQLFLSKDLGNWEPIGFVLNEEQINLQGTSTPGGIWAPHLSYDKETKKYWIAYSHMVNMDGREFNAENYAIWAYDIHGPWSNPIYLTSIGFDPSIFHDDDGKKYISILEWETREGYQAPGNIVIAEIDLNTGNLKSKWKRVTKGFTSRGCVEAPQIYKRNGYYYLINASGGTGYAHGVEIGRSKEIFGPYEPHPSGEPIITSSPRHLFSLGNPDAGRFDMFNPFSEIQKSGHGSLVQTIDDEWYMVHLMSRPLKGTLLNPLGRETSIQKMKWTADQWLEQADGTNLAKVKVEGPNNFSWKQEKWDIDEEFEGQWNVHFMSPYHKVNRNWVYITEEKKLRIFGKNSLFSKVEPSIIATRATSLNYQFETSVQFNPEHYSQTAGFGLYYDSSNWIYTYITYSEETRTNQICISQAMQGKKVTYTHYNIMCDSNAVKFKLFYNNGFVSIAYSTSKLQWQTIVESIDVSYLSDEGVNGVEGEIGGFTGMFNFIASVDAYQRESFAEFDYYRVINI
ncbi:family 43 glycosylhydrolase [Aerococcaceae bacterium zg-ZJ1578]|uniref:family 43 glycosylhydrolase n=1 Tax=Aerococcaceae bacterium zg-252 TaxID=2796928 RepID=UPI001A2D3A0F|nr:family 43 glycosylhydrolase [Aerococcaceae bacterium zg-1578]